MLLGAMCYVLPACGRLGSAMSTTAEAGKQSLTKLAKIRPRCWSDSWRRMHGQEYGSQCGFNFLLCALSEHHGCSMKVSPPPLALALLAAQGMIRSRLGRVRFICGSNRLGQPKLGRSIGYTLLTFARSALGSLLGNNNCLIALYVQICHSYYAL